jgi:hypothetical protein
VALRPSGPCSVTAFLPRPGHRPLLRAPDSDAWGAAHRPEGRRPRDGRRFLGVNGGGAPGSSPRLGGRDRGGRRRSSPADRRTSSSSPARCVCGRCTEEARCEQISSAPMGERTFRGRDALIDAGFALAAMTDDYTHQPPDSSTMRATWTARHLATSSIRQSATDQDPVPACSKRKSVLTNQIVLPRDVETRVAEPPQLHIDEAPRAHAGPFRLVKPEVTVRPVDTYPSHGARPRSSLKGRLGSFGEPARPTAQKGRGPRRTSLHPACQFKGSFGRSHALTLASSYRDRRWKRCATGCARAAGCRLRLRLASTAQVTRANEVSG